MTLAPHQIRDLWADPNFYASFTGMSTFFKAVRKLDPNIKYKQVREALEQSAIYQTHINAGKRINVRRHIYTSGSNISFEMDLLEMPSYKNYKYGLVLRDQFNLMIYFKPLKTKTTNEVKKALEELFRKNNLHPSIISSDQGKEFTSLRPWLIKEKHIDPILRRGDNKASYAEEAILRIKSRIYRALRSSLSQNWVELAPKIVLAINSSPNKGIGGLIPLKIKEPVNDPLVRSKRSRPEHPSWQEMEEHEKNVKPKFSVGQKVYLNFSRLPMYKAYDTQRGMIYIINGIDNKESPVLYKLKELDGTPLAHFSFYGAELRSAPEKDEPFHIEKIEKTRRIKGRKQHFVKFLFYPKKLVYN